MRRVIKTAVVLLVLVLMTTDACAMSLLRPYGFTLPLEEFASDPTKFGNEMYYLLNSHDASYSDGVLNLTSKNTDTLSQFNFGGKKSDGSDTIIAPTLGRQVSRFTFSISQSQYFDNKYGPAAETIDSNAFVLVGGSWTTFRFKGYTFRDTDYIAKLNWGGGDAGAEEELPPLEYDKAYTLIFEADIPNHTASMRLEDAEGNILGAKYSQNPDIQAARNGFRFRVRDDFDVKISEVSSYRESYLVNGLTVEENEDKLDVCVNMANDCTVREKLYGAAHTAPILVVGQFDKDDRLLSFNITKPELPARAATSDSVEYVPVRASVEIHKDFHHAKVCVWSDMEDMLSYCDMVQIGE